MSDSTTYFKYPKEERILRLEGSENTVFWPEGELRIGEFIFEFSSPSETLVWSGFHNTQWKLPVVGWIHANLRGSI